MLVLVFAESNYKQKTDILNRLENVKIAICFGTRPEVIKLALLSKKLESKHSVVNVFTKQHHSLYDDVKHLIPKVDYSLPIGEYESINLLYSDLTKHLYYCFNNCKPDLVIVQGDTASAYCASFCAFTMGIKVGHVEAGLRTNDIKSPFPEEFNRQMISKVSHYNWCPSQIAVDNLQKESVSGKIILTGNTIVDFVRSMPESTIKNQSNVIVVTLHRRENAEQFLNILGQIDSVAKSHPDLKFVFPAHPNPIIQKHLCIITSDNFVVVKPMKYEPFLEVLKSCKGIITDSGGIQEEAVCFKKKVLVCRDTTERKEAANVGISKIVGCDIENNFEWLLTPYNYDFENPYGDGYACEKIEQSLNAEI